MKRQPHLIESPIPLQSSKECLVLCQKKIIDAYFALSWQGGSIGKPELKLERVCKDCIEAYGTLLELRINEPITKRYLYGVIPISELKRGAEDIE